MGAGRLGVPGPLCCSQSSPHGSGELRQREGPRISREQRYLLPGAGAKDTALRPLASAPRALSPEGQVQDHVSPVPLEAQAEQ